ncbi:hypothetical protein LTR37_002615 [Vermiconidia calcicola]|uniref:Uncharacterized protein n=1 Tax=Vermiconidia calcicola TaxID=1690605 RepID=A0ACC3NT37_9PEZI|nr:hypothetical protein LTR37_002615 [Vermiconidia calcicola]
MTKTQARKARERREREERERNRRNDNIVNYFDTTYGRDVTKLEKWQLLCQDLGVDAGPSINKCKTALKGIYVNIVDFVAAKQAGEEVHLFRSYKALQTYILRTGKVFPLKRAKQSPILNWMLIDVF